VKALSTPATQIMTGAVSAISRKRSSLSRAAASARRSSVRSMNAPTTPRTRRPETWSGAALARTGTFAPSCRTTSITSASAVPIAAARCIGSSSGSSSVPLLSAR